MNKVYTAYKSIKIHFFYEPFFFLIVYSVMQLVADVENVENALFFVENLFFPHGNYIQLLFFLFTAVCITYCSHLYLSVFMTPPIKYEIYK